MELGENILEEDILEWNISASWTAGIKYFLPRVPLQIIYSRSDAVQPVEIFHQRVPFTEYFRPVWWCSARGNLPPEGNLFQNISAGKLVFKKQIIFNKWILSKIIF
jgi:hypothetical protein